MSFCCLAVGPAPSELESISHGAEQGKYNTQAADKSCSSTFRLVVLSDSITVPLIA